MPSWCQFSAGLDNLQNTCYLNSCLQALRAIPELRTAFENFSPAGGGGMGDGMAPVAAAMKGLFQQMTAGGDSVTPFMFVNIFRQTFPQFAEQRQNVYTQQDADECWNTLAQILKSQLAQPDGGNTYDALFQGEMRNTLTCVENPEDVTVTSEPFWKMPCFVDKEVCVTHSPSAPAVSLL